MAGELNLDGFTDPNSRWKRATEVSEDTETQAHSTAGPFNGHNAVPAALGLGSHQQVLLYKLPLGNHGV